MNSLLTFLANVFNELRRSLAEALGLFGDGGLADEGALIKLATRVVVSLLLVVLFAVGLRLARRGLRVFGRLPEDLLKSMQRALGYVVGLLATLAVLAEFGVDRTLLGQLASAALFSLMFYAVWLLGMRVLANAAQNKGLDRSLEQLLRNVLGVIVTSFAIITVLDQFGVDVLGVVTALGVVGLAIGFAAQSTLSNFVSGITLLIERPFHIGDWVELAGQVGRVEQISLRTTRIVTRDNVHTSIPNAAVASSEIINLSAGGPLRVRIPVGIAYKESVSAARQALLPIMQQHPLVLTGPEHTPTVIVEELGDSSVNLVMRAWIGPAAIAVQPQVSADLLERAKEALDSAGIEIPFPHLQLFLEQTEALAPLMHLAAKGTAD